MGIDIIEEIKLHKQWFEKWITRFIKEKASIRWGPQGKELLNINLYFDADKHDTNPIVGHLHKKIRIYLIDFSYESSDLKKSKDLLLMWTESGLDCYSVNLLLYFKLLISEFNRFKANKKSLFDLPNYLEVSTSSRLQKTKFNSLINEPIWDSDDVFILWSEVVRPLYFDLDYILSRKVKLASVARNAFKAYKSYEPSEPDHKVFETFLQLCSLIFESDLNRKNLIEKQIKEGKGENNFKEDEHLDIDGATEFLKLKKSTLYSYKCRGKIPYHQKKDHSKIYFLKSELRQWIIDVKTKGYSNFELERQVAKEHLKEKLNL